MVRPEQIVAAAVDAGCRSLAYTYTEPTVYLEYAYDICLLARESDLKNIFVTNGFMSQETLEMCHPFLDAANVDLKSFSNDFYRKVCNGRLEPVLHTLRFLKEKGIWVEVTTLVIPGLNDSPEEMDQVAAFIAKDLGPETPWHISAFHPDHQMADRPRTPHKTLAKAFDIGKNAGLQHVYIGNVPGSSGEHTVCPGCGKKVIERLGFQVISTSMIEGKCRFCGRAIAGVWQ
jgi:pyruvate formate lyase activating enzyme